MRRVSLDDRGMSGFVMSLSIYELRNELARHRNHSMVPAVYVINCSDVNGFTSEALAVLARTRRELNWEGHELKLINYSEIVADEMIVPLFIALLEGWSNEGVDQRPAKRVSTVLAQAA